MKVVRAGVLGFCTGVRRAVDMARSCLAANPAGTVYTLGPLIHNPQVMAALEREGLLVLDEGAAQGFHGGVAVIRAHGIPPRLEAELRGRGAAIADATCPRVKSSQLKARAFAESGCHVFLAGERHHAEIIGIEGYAALGAGTGEAVSTVSAAEEASVAAEALFRDRPATSAALIGQTTIPAETYQAIGEAIQRFFPGLKIENTICGYEPQRAMRELCAQVDAVVVVGGKSSANTRRLLGIAQALGKPAWLVETAEDIPACVAQYGVIGLSAGASTPDESIAAIESALIRWTIKNSVTGNCLGTRLSKVVSSFLTTDHADHTDESLEIEASVCEVCGGKRVFIEKSVEC